jgi:SAM-dependent methyltransferase
MNNNSVVRLNLGSGGKPIDGYINVDINPRSPGVSVVHDLDIYPWPFEDAIASEIVLNQCLEHITDNNRAMKEIHRILKPGGKAHISVPHFTWQFAFQDPTHKHFFGYNTFSYYARNCGYFDFQFSKCQVKITFGKRLSLWNYIIEPFANCFPNAYEQSPMRIFPALTVDAILEK